MIETVKMTLGLGSGGSTLCVAVDDKCLAVSTSLDGPKVWLSKDACKWIAENYKKLLDEDSK